MPVKLKSEASIQADILLELGKVFPDCVTAWRNNTGAFHDGERLIKFGIPGQADISGLIKPLGCRLEIEVKRPGGRQSANQILFNRMINQHGGLYLLCDGDIEGQVIEPIRERVERDRRVIR